MKNLILYSITLILLCNKTYSQNTGEIAGAAAGLAAITFIAINSDKIFEYSDSFLDEVIEDLIKQKKGAFSSNNIKNLENQISG